MKVSKFVAIFALAMALSPAIASAAFLNVSAEDLPPVGLTAALKNRGRAVDLAASTKAPANLTISCDSRLKIQVELLGSTEKPEKFVCKDKEREIGLFFFPGLSGARVSVVSGGALNKPTKVHFILRELAYGGDVDYKAVTLKR